jgi:hypothetical protein
MDPLKMGPFLLYNIISKNIQKGNDLMKNEFLAEREIIMQKAEELHELTTNTCKMCGGSYEENLNGAINYFILNNKRFKMTIEKI